MRPFLFTLLLTSSVAAQSCGPSAQQVGEQVLIAAPLVLLLSSLAQWLVLRLWPSRARRAPTVERDRGEKVEGDPYREAPPVGAGAHSTPLVHPPPAIPLRWTANLAMAAVLVVVAAVALELGDRTEELGLALWLFGCSYGAVVLVLTRIVLQWWPAHAFVAPHVAAIVLFLGPAAIMTLGPGPLDDVAMQLFVVPGWGGGVTAGVFVVLMVEIAIRRRIARRARRATQA